MKPDNYNNVYHCRDCEFCWALGCDRYVCTVSIVTSLPRHPHDAINFETDEEIFKYDSVVRKLTRDQGFDVNPYNGTCDYIVVR